MARSTYVDGVKPAAALILNAGAGGGPLDVEGARARLAERLDLRILESSPDRSPDACARDALAEGAQLVIAVGGDGTVSAVASVLVGSQAALAIIPRGTANSFAEALEIPSDPEQAIATILDGETVTVDSALANGKPMILHASVGFHAAVVTGTSSVSKSRFGVLAYLVKALGQVSNSTRFKVELESETMRMTCRANSITVASVAPPGTILAQGPTILLPDDGALDVTIVAAEGLVEAVATGLHLHRAASQQQAANRHNIGYFSCKRVRIDTHPPQALMIDGEDAGRGRLVIECVPGSLSVKVPRGATWRTRTRSAESNLGGLPGLRVRPRRSAV
jgi:YegS/Rv2252/BmrU family lipid kinase